MARQSTRRVASALTVILAISGSLVGCSQQTPITAPTTPSKTGQAQTVPFDLYTHCGIRDLMAFGRYFQRIGGSLSDGSGNPPDGWGNPFQRGTLTVSGDTAVFQDKLGHSERFRAAKPPDSSVALCS